LRFSRPVGQVHPGWGLAKMNRWSGYYPIGRSQPRDGVYSVIDLYVYLHLRNLI